MILLQQLYDIGRESSFWDAPSRTVVLSGFIGSISGAAIALIGIARQNRRAEKRLKLQLEHEKQENENERISTMRKEVYLNASEEIVKAMTRLPNLVHQDFSDGNLMDHFSGFSAASGKLHCVASQETVPHVTTFSGLFTSTLMFLIHEAIPIHKLRADSRANSVVYEQQIARASQIQDEQQRMILTRDGNIAKFEELARIESSYREIAEEFHQKRIDADLEMQTEMQSYLQKMAIKMKELGLAQISLLVALRRDFGFNTDEEHYRKQLEAQHKLVEDGFDQVIQTVEKELLQPIRDSR